jgi:hypothetical protein
MPHSLSITAAIADTLAMSGCARTAAAGAPSNLLCSHTVHSEEAMCCARRTHCMGRTHK